MKKIISIISVITLCFITMLNYLGLTDTLVTC